MENMLKEPLAHTNEQDTKSLADHLNAFTLDLYRKLQEQEGNLFLSPLSISTCMAMAYAGARGETETQMARALHYPFEQEQLHLMLGKLIEDLNAESVKGNYQLVIANALWGLKGYEFAPQYLELIKTRYDSELQELDFQGEAEAACQKINQWVAEQTREKIREIVNPDALDDLTRLVLTNAIYFKGSWSTPFPEYGTSPEPFKTKAGSSGSDQVDVSMMAITTYSGYLEGEHFQALELPYQGGELSMVIFLPKEIEGLANFEQSLTPSSLTAWLPRLQGQEVEVHLPKFKMTSAFQLPEILKSMGMVDAFRLGVADFSGMTDEKDVGISDVLHKAFVEVNEEGTEAAAVTGELCEALCADPAPPPPPPVFRSDHPFFFLIRHISTESILFLGRVVDPRMFEPES